MAFKIVRADPEIIRREGLGAEQCAACGQVYRINHVPERCINDKCPTNDDRPSMNCPDITELLFNEDVDDDSKPSYDSEMGQGCAGYNDFMFGDGGE